jgi:uncharacterized protein (TIGR01244 family)
MKETSVTTMWTPQKAQLVEEGFYVTPQLLPGDVAAAKASGFASIINNRPDWEGGASQPPSAELEASAAAAGVTYHHLPVPPAGHNEEDARRMAELVRSSPRPILAFCRTGTRSAALYKKGKTLG